MISRNFLNKFVSYRVIRKVNPKKEIYFWKNKVIHMYLRDGKYTNRIKYVMKSTLFLSIVFYLYKFCKYKTKYHFFFFYYYQTKGATCYV